MTNNGSHKQPPNPTNQPGPNAWDGLVIIVPPFVVAVLPPEQPPRLVLLFVEMFWPFHQPACPHAGKCFRLTQKFI
ncbi:hypothetical protein Mapa_013416 [Marchantia paleacea]|nr:hypothetical protein Mapa_013416 [Marchantia paleacea]